MLTSVRAGLAAAFLALAFIPALAAARQSLPARPISTRRRSSSRRRSRATPARSPSRPRSCARDADAAFQKNDFRTGMVVLGQLVAVAPDDARELAAPRARRAADPAARRPRDARCCSIAPATAAYIAYQRAKDRGDEADSLAHARPHASPTASIWRPALDAHAAFARAARERRPARRTTSGCATSTASACSITRSIPTPSRRAPASSSPRNCPASAPISRPSSRSPAGQAGALGRRQAALRRRPQARRALHDHAARRPAVDRARRRWRSRPTSPSIVRDRKPFVRFSGKAYVLPRTGQRGIPVVSVNTTAVEHRDLPHRRPQSARHRARQRLPAQSRPLRGRAARRRARRQGVERRARGRAEAQCRGHHGVPGRRGGRRPGARRLCDDGGAEGARSATTTTQLATQWFIVSDLGPHRLFGQ